MHWLFPILSLSVYLLVSVQSGNSDVIGDAVSSNHVTLRVHGNTGEQFLQRLFEVLTIILLSIILLLFIFTVTSVVWFCVQSNRERKEAMMLRETIPSTD